MLHPNSPSVLERHCLRMRVQASAASVGSRRTRVTSGHGGECGAVGRRAAHPHNVEDVDEHG